MQCDLCSITIRRAYRYAWRPADPDPKRIIALHWSCAPILTELVPKTWVYKGAPRFRLYMDGFEQGNVLILGEWDPISADVKRAAKRHLESLYVAP